MFLQMDAERALKTKPLMHDDSLEDIDNLPAPVVLATEIADNLEAAQDRFRKVTNELSSDAPPT
jgi:hypothetical protein